MLEPNQPTRTPSKVVLRRSYFRVAVWVIPLSLAAPTGASFAQQINPFVQPETAPTSVITSLSAPVITTAKPGHFGAEPFTTEQVAEGKPAALDAEPERLPLPRLLNSGTLNSGAVQAVPASTNVSRFQPMQVRTPTWLPAVTSSSKQIEGRRLLDQAHHEYAVAAYASAEASAWNALRHFAEAINGTAHPSQSASNPGSVPLTAPESLAIAETAIRESRDFSGKYGSVDAAAIQRFVQCHQTNVLRPSVYGTAAVTTATEAIDRYMNEARIHLSPIAAASVDAAEAMDLLAEIYLGRYEADTLSNEVSLTLWRAVVQGQPHNPMVASTLGKQLARVGLFPEARWALEHSLSLASDPQTALALSVVSQKLGDARLADQLNTQLAQWNTVGAPMAQQRVPEVIQLAPEQFAAISQPVMINSPGVQTTSPVQPEPNPQPVAQSYPVGQSHSGAQSQRVPAVLASARLNQSTQATQSVPQPMDDNVVEPMQASEPSLLKSLFKRLGGSK